MKTRRIALVGTLTAALALGGAASAGANDEPDPAEFTPPGYEFCGWLDLETKQWKTVWSDRLIGVYVILYARNTDCRSARRNYSRTRFAYRNGKNVITRSGYRCKLLKNQHEFMDYRCTKIGRPSTAYRVQTGA